MAKKPKATEEKNPVLGGVEHTHESADTAPEDGIGSRIRAAREARGWSQVALATRSKMMDSKGQGVSRTGLVGYEAGTTKPGAREIRILSETLLVTPNWLIFGADNPAHESAQASMEAVRKADLVAAIRLALAISVLKTHERSAFQSLVLSMAGRELGDLKLSALLMMAVHVAEPALKELEKRQAGVSDGTIAETLNDLVRHYSDGVGTNYGNKLKFLKDSDGDFTEEVSPESEWLYPEPPPASKR